MAKTESASIVTLIQPKRPMTQAERAKAYRLRKKVRASQTVTPEPVTVTSPVTASRRSAASWMLVAAAFGLAAVGITMNGWFARSLGSSDLAGWLFLAVGVAADCVALAVPSCAARMWGQRQRVTAVAGWAVWAVSFAFAVMAGIGFASINITDVTMARASRVTPAITSAQTALTDAMTARDRECRSGTGKFCREREMQVVDRRHMLDAASAKVEGAADPQTEAAVRAVIWLSGGILKPTMDDFGMLRLILLAMLPQIGGVLLMLGRAK